MAPFTHCIFDMDGLLLDTERIYTEATNIFLSRHKPGATFTWELKSKLMGMAGHESHRLFLDTMGIDMPVDECAAEQLEIQENLFPKCKLLPGVERLLRHLHASGIPMAVATSSTRQKMLIKTQHHREVFDLFGEHVTCSSDDGIKKGKPAPDIFLAAREKFGKDGEVPPVEKCLVFEDAYAGIEAARRAGMPAVWVPDPELRALARPEGFVEPHVTLKSLEEFDPTKFGLPAWTD